MSVEDSTGCMHGSRARVEPAGELLRSEPPNVAALAQAMLRRSARRWRRGAYVDTGWFPPADAGHAAHLADPERPRQLHRTSHVSRGSHQPPVAGDMLRLFTLRSDRQFNTTTYNKDDRFRGTYGGRGELLTSPSDIGRLDFVAGDLVDVNSHALDGLERRVSGLRLVTYNMQDGSIGGYYPECNPSLPPAHHALEAWCRRQNRAP